MTEDPARRSVVTSHARGSVLALMVVPRAATNAFEMQADGIPRVRITAPPVDGAANAALLRFLADALDLSRSRLTIASGESGRRKRIVIEGVDPDDLAQRLRDTLGIASVAVSIARRASALDQTSH